MRAEPANVDIMLRGRTYGVRSFLVGHSAVEAYLTGKSSSVPGAGHEPLQIIQEALGHASIQTTTKYAHVATPKRLGKLTRFLE